MKKTAWKSLGFAGCILAGSILLGMDAVEKSVQKNGSTQRENIRKFNWPGEKDAVAWQILNDASVQSGTQKIVLPYTTGTVEPFSGTHYLRCGSKTASAAILRGIKVKPNTGYIARCRFQGVGDSHMTFGILNPDDQNLKWEERYFACRSSYIAGGDQWEELLLPFRTKGQEIVGIIIERHYGSGEIVFDAVELVEDDSVAVGEIVPAANSFPEVKSEEKARGYLVSHQHWMQLVFGSYYPKRDEITNSVGCWLSPGQYEPMTFSLTGLRDLKNVTVKLSEDLKSKEGSILSVDQVNIGTVRTITRWLTNSAPQNPGQRYEKRPLFIFPNEAGTIAPRETKTWWLTVHAPEEQNSGIYHGKIVINAEGTPKYTLDVSVEVLPIKLSKPEVTYGMYYRHSEQPAEFKTEEFFIRAARDMKTHGMNSISIYAQLEKQEADGWVTDLDFAGRGNYSINRQMEMLKEAGLAQIGHPLLFLPSHAGTDQIRDYDKTLPVLGKKQKEAGWPELLLYLFDEVGGKVDQWETLDLEMKRVAEARKKYPELALRLTTADPGEKAHYYDVIIRGEKKAGKEMWTYNCTWNGSQPVNDRYFAGYHVWSEGLRGCWQWCYTENKKLELTDSGEIKMGAYQDPWQTNYVLPGEKGNMPTLGWEARREGVDDYRYLQTLRETISQAKKSKDPEKRKLAEKAQQFLVDVKTKAKVPAVVGFKTQICAERTYSFVMHPGLTLNYYDQVRREAAEWIIRLSK